MIDLHCHLDLYPNPKNVVQECVKRKMYILSVTTTPSAWTKTNELANGASRIKTALGLHPQLAGQRKSELPLFDQLISKTRYVGEIGLDGSKEYFPFWSSQVAVFDYILKKCDESDDSKILSIHSRNAAKEVLESLSRFNNVGKVILHWYSGNKTCLNEAIQRGYWFSINPVMIRSKNGQSIIASIPKNRILLESDGPFTTIDNRALFPWDTTRSFDKLQEIWNITKPQVTNQILANFKELIS